MHWLVSCGDPNPATRDVKQLAWLRLCHYTNAAVSPRHFTQFAQGLRDGSAIGLGVTIGR